MINIKECVKSSVRFVQYKDGNFWYKTVNDDLFPVPLEEVGTATLYAVDKGLLFLRYMRAWNKVCENKGL